MHITFFCAGGHAENRLIIPSDANNLNITGNILNATKANLANNLTREDFGAFDGLLKSEHPYFNKESARQSPKIVITYVNKTTRSNHMPFDPLMPFHKFFLLFLLNAHKNPNEENSTGAGVNEVAMNEINSSVMKEKRDINSPVMVSRNLDNVTKSSSSVNGTAPNNATANLTSNNSSNEFTKIKRAATTTANGFVRIPPDLEKNQTSKVIIKKSAHFGNDTTKSQEFSNVDVQSTANVTITAASKLIEVNDTNAANSTIVKKALDINSYFANESAFLGTNMENTSFPTLAINNLVLFYNKSERNLSVFDPEPAVHVKRHRRSHINKINMQPLTGKPNYFDKDVSKESPEEIRSDDVEQSKDFYLVFDESDAQKTTIRSRSSELKSTTKDDFLDKELERMLQPMFSGLDNELKKDFYRSETYSMEQTVTKANPLFQVTLPTVLCKYIDSYVSGKSKLKKKNY